jgi:HK97 family phage prohead protease
MEEIETKLIAFGHVEKSANPKEIVVVASDETEDRQGEIVRVSGWQLKNFKSNPVMLVSHDYTQLPIGTWEVSRRDGRLIAKAKFSSIPKAQEVETLVKEGILSAVSVGFIVRQRNEVNPSIIEKAELLEISWVSVPANPSALMLAYEKGYTLQMKKSPEVEKSEKLLEHYKSVVKGYRELLKTLQEKHGIKIEGEKVEETEQIAEVLEAEKNPKVVEETPVVEEIKPEAVVNVQPADESIEQVAAEETPKPQETPVDNAEIEKAVGEAMKPYLDVLKKYI